MQHRQRPVSATWRRATATRELPGAGGRPVTASAPQSASLASVADLFGVVLGTAQDISDRVGHPTDVASPRFCFCD